MISFDNSFFFKKSGLDLNNNKDFKDNLDLAYKSSSRIYEDFKNGKNEILQSFTKKYQKKIRDVKIKKVNLDKKKLLLALEDHLQAQKPYRFF